VTNLACVVARQAAESGDRPFCTFITGDTRETITFAQLFARSARYAAWYRARGIEAGDLVAIILKHTPEQFYAFLGAVLTGALPAFMPYATSKQDAGQYWNDHRRLFERIEPALVVTYPEHAALARDRLGDLPIVIATPGEDALAAAGGAHAFRGLDAAGDAVAALQHSSGTTALKKGVMLSHRAIFAQIDAYARAIDVTERDVIASWLPFYHDMGFVACFLTALVRGIHLVALDPFEWASRPRMLFEAIERYRATLTWLPNFAFAHLVNTARPTDRWDLSSMRAFISCSEPCRPRAFDRFLERFASCGVRAEHLAVCYALAENVFAATQTVLGTTVRRLTMTRDDGRPVELLSCGRPIDGVEIDIRDPQGRLVSDGTIGEITLRGSFLADGYFRQPERTASAFRDDGYFTGDLGLIDGDELYVTGRIDDLLIVNGRNVHAHEIEAIVSEVRGCIPGRAVAFCDERCEDGMPELVVVAEMQPDADAAQVARAMKAAVAQHLAIAVSRVVQIERGALMKTTSGKVSRAAR